MRPNDMFECMKLQVGNISNGNTPSNCIHWGSINHLKLTQIWKKVRSDQNIPLKKCTHTLAKQVRVASCAAMIFTSSSAASALVPTVAFKDFHGFLQTGCWCVECINPFAIGNTTFVDFTSFQAWVCASSLLFFASSMKAFHTFRVSWRIWLKHCHSVLVSLPDRCRCTYCV